jgi:trigger factor
VEVNIQTLSDVQQEAEIQVTDEELRPHFDLAYERFRPKVELKGFRKGKVPLAMIKKLYGEAIEQEALDNVATEFYRQVMQERNIRPIGQPSMVDMDFKRGEHFRFKIQYEVRPDIQLKNYKGIAVEKPVHHVSDDELEREIDHLRRLNSTLSPAEKAADNDHVVTADVQELDDSGSPLIGKKTQGAKFYLTDETLAVEIKDALLGATVDEDVRVHFESRHDDHVHKIHLAIAVKGIEKVTLPEFDDAFVSKISSGKVTSVDTFRENMRADLMRFWEEQSEKKVAEGIVSEIVRQHEFTVPDSLVHGLLDSYVEDVQNKSRDRKLPSSFDENKFREENRALAVWQAKWMLLKGKIAEEEQITVSEEELRTSAETEAKRVGIPAERMLEYYRQSDVMSDRILSDKLMTFLKEHAIITEKVVDAPDTR